jgi:hypothetical protein
MQNSFEGPPGAPEVGWQCHKCGEKVLGTKICPKCGASKPATPNGRHQFLKFIHFYIVKS